MAQLSGHDADWMAHQAWILTLFPLEKKFTKPCLRQNSKHPLCARHCPGQTSLLFSLMLVYWVTNKWINKCARWLAPPSKARAGQKDSDSGNLKAAREGLLEVATRAGSPDWSEGTILSNYGGNHTLQFSQSFPSTSPQAKFPSSPQRANICFGPWLQRTDIIQNLFERTYMPQVDSYMLIKWWSILWVLLRGRNTCVWGIALSAVNF